MPQINNGRFLDRGNPGIGLLLVVVSALLVWGGAASCVFYAFEARQETKAIELACEKMIEYGWAISLPDCVEELQP